MQSVGVEDGAFHVSTQMWTPCTAHQGALLVRKHVGRCEAPDQLADSWRARARAPSPAVASEARRGTLKE